MVLNNQREKSALAITLYSMRGGWARKINFSMGIGKPCRVIQEMLSLLKENMDGKYMTVGVNKIAQAVNQNFPRVSMNGFAFRPMGFEYQNL